MLDKILKYIPIYTVFYAFKYFIVLLQLPTSFAKLIFTKPEIIKIKEYSNEHKFIFIYASIEPTISQSSSNVLNVIKELGGYIVLITNSSKYTLTDKSKSLVDVFINNKDRGWDFSQYKIASNYIYKNLANENYTKVIYQNDSVFYLSNNLNHQLAKLLDIEYDFISFFDGSGVYRYHLSSWSLSVSKNIFLDKKIKRFWGKFFEVKNKFYSIMQGEFAFSKAVFSLFPKSQVIYNNHFLNLSKELNLSNTKYISESLMEDFYDSINFMYGFDNKNTDPLKDYIFHNTTKYPFIQTFGLLLLKFHDMPFIKKDLFWLEHQSLSSFHLLEAILVDKVDKDYVNTIKAYFLNRGHLSGSTLHRKILTFLGIR